MAFLGWAAIMTAFLVMGGFMTNPWRLDLRKLLAGQALFWLGLLALTYAACMTATLFCLGRA